MTCPVIDSLIDRFPEADISIVVGPKAQGLFEGNPYFKDVLLFDKHQSFYNKVKWAWDLRKRSFDMVIDLRHTVIPLVLTPRYRTLLFRSSSKERALMAQKHLLVLKTVIPDIQRSLNKNSVFITDQQEALVSEKFISQINPQSPFFVVAPGSANPHKRWHTQGFIAVINALNKKTNFSTIFVGDQDDVLMADQIIDQVEGCCVNLCGQTSLIECATIIKKSVFGIVNDSAVLHLLSYFDVPVVALFGPSDPMRYGPWGAKGYYLTGQEKENQVFGDIRSIAPEKVIEIIFSKIL